MEILQKEFEVTVRASVTKTLKVTAATASEAETIAHHQFNVLCLDDDKRYVQETVGNVTPVVVGLPVIQCKPLKYVVVANPGMHNEVVIDEFASFQHAARFVRKREDFGIMKRLADGSLTTEF